jgi:putative hydrolase of the HAD superfamily
VSADLSHVETWLFDLDNTLYPLESGLADEISARITAYVERLTGLEAPAARALQKRYLAEHGLTLRGLVLHHGVDPDEFHAIFADLPLAALSPDPELIAAIERLPGRRLVFTNADEAHAGRVLRRLGLTGLIDEVFHIGRADFMPKPHPTAFARLIAACRIDPARTCFFEDSAANLEPASALGMTTVLVGKAARSPRPPFVDHLAPELGPFLRNARVRTTA